MASRLLVCALAAGSFLEAQTRIEVYCVTSAVIEKRLQLDVKKNDERRARLVELFQEAGCTDEMLSSPTVHGSKIPNLICTLPGESASIIVIGAHFDAVDKGHGIVDNWSGAALLPSIFEALKSKPRPTHWYSSALREKSKACSDPKITSNSSRKTIFIKSARW